MCLDKGHTRLFKQIVVVWIVRQANRLKEWPSGFVTVLVASEALSTNYSSTSFRKDVSAYFYALNNNITKKCL